MLKIWDIKLDLRIEGYEGKILFFIPKPEKIHCISDHSTGYSGARIISGIEDEKKEIIRWKRQWDDQHSFMRENEKLETFAVFNQGILLPKTEMPWDLQGNIVNQVNPRVKAIINLIGKSSLLIDISRSKPSDDNKSWFDPISKAIINKIFEEEKILNSNNNPKLKLLKIGQLLSYYPISFKEFVRHYPHEKAEIPVLKEKGKIEFFPLNEFGEKKIFTIPSPIINIFQKILSQNLFETRKETTPLSYWIGEDCVPLTSGDYHDSSAVIHELMNFSNNIVKKHFLICDEIRFLSPVTRKSQIIMQKILSPYHGEKLYVDLFLKKCKEKPESLSPLEIYFFNEEMRFKNPLGYFIAHPYIYHFAKPYQNWFAYNHSVINYDNLITHELIRILSKIHQIEKTQQNADLSIYIGNILESFETLFSSSANKIRNESDFKKALNFIWDSAYKTKFIDKKLKERLNRIDISFIISPYDQIDDYSKSGIKKEEINSNFGRVITRAFKK